MFEFATWWRGETKCEIAPPYGSTPHTAEVIETVLMKFTGLELAGIKVNRVGVWRHTTGVQAATTSLWQECRAAASGRRPSASSQSWVFRLFHVAGVLHPKPWRDAGSQWMRSTTETFHMLSCGPWALLCQGTKAHTTRAYLHKQSISALHVREQSCKKWKRWRNTNLNFVIYSNFRSCLLCEKNLVDE